LPTIFRKILEHITCMETADRTILEDIGGKIAAHKEETP
jgi:hypothetical protein